MGLKEVEYKLVEWIHVACMLHSTQCIHTTTWNTCFHNTAKLI